MCNCVCFRISLNAWKVRIIWNRIFINIYEANISRKYEITKLVITVLLFINKSIYLQCTWYVAHRIKLAAELTICHCFFRTPNLYMDPFSHFRFFNAFRKASCSSDVRCYVITHWWRQSVPHLLKSRFRLGPLFLQHKQPLARVTYTAIIRKIPYLYIF
jgi:hypothetical protein